MNHCCLKKLVVNFFFRQNLKHEIEKFRDIHTLLNLVTLSDVRTT